ncbi:hypothetical protein, partial [Aeromonas caviae]|uniref:hypothetical protein n=1 Tax=Aeromonas caviae TaxID=648 RepID=UPI002B48D289
APISVRIFLKKCITRDGPHTKRRPTSLSTGYAVAFVSLKGCLHPMPMDFSGLLRRLLTDSHIDFTSFKGGA